jgi:hypothetical protein
VAAKAAGARAQNAEARAAALEVELLARDQAYNRAVAENAAMVAQIAQRDREWAAEVAAYRQQLTAFVAASSPERLALLRRFASGDRSGAYPLLLELIDLESRARGSAAEKIAAAVRSAAAAQADNDRRLVGILALDGLGSHEISVQQAMLPWQAIVDSGRGQRADYLLLSSLWALDADDLKAMNLRRLGLARETGSEVVDRFPILATLERMSLQPGSGSWQSMATLAKSPEQPITNAPAEIRGLMMPPKQPFTSKFAPLLEQLALCETSVTARAQAETALDLQELDSQVGAQAFQPPRPAVTVSEVQCAGAGDSLRTLFAASEDRAVTDAMTAMVAPLVYGLIKLGKGEVAREVSGAPSEYCQARDPSPAQSGLMVASCALIEIAGTPIDADRPNPGREAIRRAMNNLKRVDIAKLPTPETAWFVAFADELAAMQLEELGDLPGAAAALERAMDAVSTLSRRGELFPAIEATSLSIVGSWADVRGRQADASAARAAFAKAHTTIDAFLKRYPNSLAACDASDELAESEITWFAKQDLEHALDRVDSLQPERERCGRLMDDVTGTPLRALDGRPISVVSREFSYMEIAQAAHQAGNTVIELAAFSGLEVMTRGGEDPKAHPWVVRSHTIYLEALGNLMQERGDLAGALGMFQRLANLARLTANRSRQLVGLDRAGRLAFTLGRRETAEAMWADKVRLCGTALRHRPRRARPSTLDARMAELDVEFVDLGCFFVRSDEAESSKALFARELAAMSEGLGSDSGEAISRRADLLFYLGLAEDLLWNRPEASAAYEKSLALRLNREHALSASSEALTPYVMARRATLPAGEEWWPRLEAWLLKAKAARQLTRDEEDLLLLARNKGERI